MSMFRTNLCLSFLLTASLALASSASAREKRPVPPAVQSAKTIFLVNQTGNHKVIEMAHDKFADWGRFTFAPSKEDADLVIVFTRASGMDKWGNVGFTVMNVYVKDAATPAFVTRNALHLLGDSEHRTKACVHDFQQWLARK